MKINWKVRLKNPIFWVQILTAIIMPILTYFGLTAEDMTTWQVLGETLLNAIKNPYVVFTIIVAIWGVINDPTVKGLGDSTQALNYTKPKDENNEHN